MMAITASGMVKLQLEWCSGLGPFKILIAYSPANNSPETKLGHVGDILAGTVALFSFLLSKNSFRLHLIQLIPFSKIHITSALTPRVYNSKQTASKDPSEPTSMPPRRTYRKPRWSCVVCKQRRVRCDETGPPCGGCCERGVEHECRYTRPDHHLQQGVSTGLDDNGPSNNFQAELEC